MYKKSRNNLKILWIWHEEGLGAVVGKGSGLLPG